MAYISLLACIFYFSKIIWCYDLDESSLMELSKLTDLSIKGFGFRKVQRDNPFLSYQNGKKMCDIFEKDEYQEFTLSTYPGFQKIYSDCQIKSGENSTCFATCIFYGIIQQEDYGVEFLNYIKSGANFYYNESQPYPHTTAHDLHNHENIFCFSNEFRSVLLNNIFACKLPLSGEFCIIDEEEVYCDSELGNCNFDRNKGKQKVNGGLILLKAVISAGHKAHPLECGSLETIKSRLFKKSAKFHCILQRSKLLSNMARPLFSTCEICSDKRDRRNKIAIDYSKLPTKEEFANVAYSPVPIIIRNGANFDKMLSLNFSFIQQIYDGFDFKERKVESCEYSNVAAPFDDLEDAISMIRDDAKWDTPWYLLWTICHPDILKRFHTVLPRPSFLPDDHPTSENIPRILVGTPGYGVFYHIDYNRKRTMQAQLSGSKTWMLRPPPECQHVCSKWIKLRVNQGDILIMPTNIWYHETFIEDGPLSIAYTMDYDVKDNVVILDKIPK